MNGVTRAIYAIPHGFLKLSLLKVLHFKSFRFGLLPRIDFRTEISLSFKSKCLIGKRFNLRSNSIIRVRSGASLSFGNNVSVAENCIITCRENIMIGDGTEISPHCLIYDHDHDFRAPSGIKEKKFRTSRIIIGKNVWIGANSIVLRGTKIGDNCVIGAGSIVKGDIPSNSIFVNGKVDRIIAIKNE